MQKVTPFLWYNGNLGEAIDFYKSVFKNFILHSAHNMGDKMFTATFEIEGQLLMGLDGGPMYQPTPAFSLFINCSSQEEVDALWDKLLADGGKESRCGWLIDKFGLSWQVIPTKLGELLYSSDRAGSQRAMQAMMKMNKIIIKDLQDAFDDKE